MLPISDMLMHNVVLFYSNQGMLLFYDLLHQDEENAKAISLFENVVRLNDDIEDEGKRLENLVRGIFAGNIFDLGSAQVG